MRNIILSDKIRHKEMGRVLRSEKRARGRGIAESLSFHCDNGRAAPTVDARGNPWQSATAALLLSTISEKVQKIQTCRYGI